MLPVMLREGATNAVTAVIAGDGSFGAALVGALERHSRGTVVGLAAVDVPADAVVALEQVPDVSALVHVCGDDASLASRSLASTDVDVWNRGCERVVWRALTSLQAAHAVLSRRGGGRVVMVTATAGLSGAAHAVPLVAALEGTRSMSKSAARQWGAAGIAVNCVAVPLDLLAPADAGLTSFLPPAALSTDDTLGDVAGAVAFLAGPDSHGITGATLLVDGGAVMAP